MSRLSSPLRPIFEALEERKLLSADLLPLPISEVLPTSPSLPAVRAFDFAADAPRVSMNVQVAPAGRELLLVDAAAPDADRLIADFVAAKSDPDAIEVVKLAGDRDGVAQVSALLADRRDLRAIHILSHGEPGAIRLGASTLDLATLAARTDEIRAWSNAIAVDGDLLVYGCDVAATVEGGALVAGLADLTGADVAASADLTGASVLGGDWDLECRTGSIDAVPVVALGWQGLLSTQTLKWNDIAGTWPLGSLSGSYTVGPGTVSINITPTNGPTLNTAVDTQENGGLGPSVNSLRVPPSGGFDPITNQSATITLDFTYLNGLSNAGVSNARFLLADIDTNGGVGFVDNVEVTATAASGTVNPSSVTLGPEAVGQSGTPANVFHDSHVVTGDAVSKANSPTGASNGDALFVFTQSGITRITIVYSNVGAQSPQHISLHDITFDPTPGASNQTVTTDEDIAYTFKLGDFGFSDVDGDPLQTVRITQLPGAGTLLRNGLTVATGQDISAADITGNQLTFQPAANANGAPYTNFRFRVGDGASLSAADYTMTIDVASVNDPPVLGAAGGTLAYTEGNGAQVIDATLSLTDVDDTQIESATVAISGGFVNTEDVLAFVNTANITGNYLNGVLTLSGTDTLANYEAALESVTYANRNTDNPNTGNRAITWLVNDGNANSAGIASTITVAAVNRAPTVAAPAARITSEDSPIAFSPSTGNGIVVGDIDSAALTVTLGSSNGTVTLSSVGGLSFSLGTGSGDAAMTFTGSAPAINAALDGLVFTPTPNASGSADLAVAVSDGALGASANVPLVLLPVADAPVLTIAPARGNEDHAIALSVAAALTDTDGSESLAVAIDDIPVGATLSDGTNTFTATSGHQRVSLAGWSLGSLSITPAPNSFAPFSLSVSATATESAGGASATSAASLAVVVTPLNDAPVLAAPGLRVAEGGATMITSANLHASDIDDVPADLVYTLTAVPMHGPLLLAGRALAVGDTFTQADVDAGRLQYVHDGSETTGDAFGFDLADASGATAAGGMLAIAVAPVNDPPVLVSATLAVEAGQAQVLRAELAATDPDNPASSLVFTVANVRDGRFERVDAPGVAISSFTQGEIDAGLVRFVSTSRAIAPSFEVYVSDGSITVGPRAANVLFTPDTSSGGTGFTLFNPPAVAEQDRGVVRIDGPALLSTFFSLVDPTLATFIRHPTVPATPAVSDGPMRDGVAARSGEAAPLDSSKTTVGDAAIAFDPPVLSELEHSSMSVEVISTRGVDIDPGQGWGVNLDAMRLTGMVLSVGFVWWAARASGLLASLLASAPAWRHLDPLPVLAHDARDRRVAWAQAEDEEAEREEHAVASLLDRDG